ncbi:VOC family protein [Sinosporangium siamense]|uniref:Catechol 2,3-dioxygenase n=2 Tax=Sinosporangium siamense TaxID=1367973 RepID=A0A919VA44_9ACTN|nr:VOC family protein [Sinosporangium siamense]GII90739.1 catechol 2,3-dioxygenase [Sinosporangium siamense]
MSVHAQSTFLQIPQTSEPVKKPKGLGIHRTGHVTLFSPDPAASADFAVRHLGFVHAGHDDDGRHYLAGHGPDAYSLVYAPGEKGLQAISYIVTDAEALEEAAAALAKAGVAVTRDDRTSRFRQGPSIRFQTPAGHPIELITGLAPDVPVAASTRRPTAVPAPIASDHVVMRTVDMDAEIAYASTTLGLMESSRIQLPDNSPLMAFFRANKLYHCLALARADVNGLHHVQFTVKDGPAVLEAHEAMTRNDEVEILWGPVRHGPGHNVAIYFRDHVGHIMEFSSEEETILDDENYSPQRWSGGDHRSMDEWGTFPPESFM